MVIDSKSYEVLHPLTEEGKIHYQELLEHAADEILYRHQHKFAWFLEKLTGFFTDK